MTTGDVPAVARLCAQWGYPANAEQVLKRFRQLEGDPEGGLYVALAESVAVAGWVHVRGHRSLAADPVAEIVGIVVDRTRRRQGVGRTLVARAERWARERGYTLLRLRSNTVRPEAHAFYPALGYRRVKTSHVYSKDLAPATSE